MLMTLIAAGIIASCSGEESHKVSYSSTPTTTPIPTPTATAYLGIEDMWRGHVASIDRNVLDVWVKPRPESDAYDTAIDVLDHLQAPLKTSAFQIVIIKVGPGPGSNGLKASFVFAKDQHGRWPRMDDRTMLDGIIRAGL